MSRIYLPLAALIVAAVWGQEPKDPPLTYIKKENRHETIVASFKASGLPDLGGAWYYIGPFDNSDNKGFRTAYPPEREINLDRSYPDKNGKPARWRELRDFRLGEVIDLARFEDNDDSCVYLYHEIEAREPLATHLLLGSDDTITVWLNGEKLLAKDVRRSAAPDQERVPIVLKSGKNALLLKIGNSGGDWAVYVRPEFPGRFEAQLRNRLGRDFGGRPSGTTPSQVAAEARHYRLATLPIPENLVLEVGGLAFRPDGQLLVCTRRGDVWRIANPCADEPGQIHFHPFAMGLHEALGLCVDGKDVLVVQRPELTRLVDRDGDDRADEYATVCDRWGVSGDYHEFAFGPARDRAGNYYVTLNVGFGGGHQSKAPWRGWCMRITPDGRLQPVACGLRSPNGINFSPEGDLFYCDNQGEWVATCKMHHVREGDYYGHPAGLRWARFAPFADRLPAVGHASGMLYDGQAGKSGVSGRPPLAPPAVWFPYDRMGKSISEPVWDTTGGKFGPFAGQCFVGDQTNANVMRVFLERVNGRYQGACFPFRSGFECGVNRLAFAPDGSLFVGMTNRGWGSLGGKPFGLQRLISTGVTPFEVHSMRLTPTGFELAFTQPLDEATAASAGNYALSSHTYNYWSTYGSPEMDHRPEKITRVQVTDDRSKVKLEVESIAGRQASLTVAGRVYALRLEGIRSQAGEPVLHPEAYYTLNERIARE